MPNEIPLPPPNQALTAPGTLSVRQKRWITAGIILAVFMLLVFSIHSTPPPAQPTVRKSVLPRTEPSQLQEAPPADQKPSTTPTEPPTQPQPQQTQTAYVQPAQTEVDQLKEERRQREEKAAFESSVIPRATPPAPPVPSQPSTAVVVSAPPTTPTYTLPEGTIINCALVNKLNGDFAGPVEAQVMTDVYAPGTRTLLIPQGARVLGETTHVSGLGQSRLVVAFHRVLYGPHSEHSISLDKAPGLDQEGATALKDKVDNHYASIFGASLAVGVIGGLAQIGNGTTGYGYSPSTEFRNGISESMAQSSSRILDRFLQRTPTITIRSGTRMSIYITGDLPIPAYEGE